MAETIKEVLQHARDFHRQVGDFYERMNNLYQKERVKMLLDYMSRHERYLEKSLVDYEKGAARHVLNAAIKSIPALANCKCFDGVKIHPDMSADEVIRIALKLDHCLMALYRTMAEKAGSEEVRALFHELLELEKREEHQFSRDAMELEDV